MSSALLTTGQARWGTHAALILLSAVSIATSVPSSLGGVTMWSMRPGDIRGVQLLIGACTLGSSTCLRAVYVMLPKPWRIYLDRVEFAVMSMIWIAWTSATMSFSAFTIHEGVCSTDLSDTYLPTCPILTFDLVLLHLLSIVTLCLLLSVLSTALSPGYYLAHSSAAAYGDGAKDDPESADMLVMWDLALASPPSSPRVAPALLNPYASKSYGTTESTVPVPGAQGDDPEFPAPITTKRDKFAQGRLASYLAIFTCSLGVCGASITSILNSPGRYSVVSAFLIAAAVSSAAFTSIYLVRQWRRQASKGKSASSTIRRDRLIEVTCLGILFLLWPILSIILTLFPPTPNRPCTNPAASFESPDDLPEHRLNLLCITSTTAVTLGWMASWLILARVIGLIVPVPELGKAVLPIVDHASGEEGRSLLRSEPVPAAARPQVGWGRIVAGEAFELGDDEDD